MQGLGKLGSLSGGEEVCHHESWQLEKKHTYNTQLSVQMRNAVQLNEETFMTPRSHKSRSEIDDNLRETLLGKWFVVMTFSEEIYYLRGMWRCHSRQKSSVYWHVMMTFSEKLFLPIGVR